MLEFPYRDTGIIAVSMWDYVAATCVSDKIEGSGLSPVDATAGAER